MWSLSTELTAGSNQSKEATDDAHKNRVAALLSGAATQSTGAVSASQVNGTNGGPRPSSAPEFMRADVESLADLSWVSELAVAPESIVSIHIP